MNPVVARRLAAELIGTGLLVAVVVGSGIAATRLTSDSALRLLVSSLVTAMGLAVLILVFMPAGGAQFNPVVTGADWLLRRRTAQRYPAGHAIAVIGCQVAGAVAGAVKIKLGLRLELIRELPGTVPILCSLRNKMGLSPSPRRFLVWQLAFTVVSLLVAGCLSGVWLA